MARIESTFVLVIAVVTLIYLLIHFHVDIYLGSLSGNELEQRDSHELHELNHTLTALNTALKDLLASRTHSNIIVHPFEASHTVLPSLKDISSRHTNTTIDSSGLQNQVTKHPTKILLSGKRAVIFTMDSIKSCMFGMMISIIVL